MKRRFECKKMMYLAFAFLLLKIALTFVCFFYNRFLPASFISVLYIYFFIFSLFSNNMELAVQLMPYMFTGAALPSIFCALMLRRNRNFAGLAAFGLMLLCLGDILFVLVKGLIVDTWFGLGSIGLNLLIIACLVIMHSKNPFRPAE